MPTDPIVVHSVDQEYWYVRRQRCLCGGTLEVLGQALIGREGKALDSLSARCTHCGKSLTYEFDTCEYGPAYQMQVEMKVAQYRKMSAKEIRLAIRRSFRAPVAVALDLISSAGENGDVLALEYLSDAITLERMKLQEQEEINAKK